MVVGAAPLAALSSIGPIQDDRLNPRAVLVIVAAVAAVGCSDERIAPATLPIVGGELTSEYPAVVAIEFPQNRFTGTLVTPQIVLTVAHGVDETVGTPAVEEGIVRVGATVDTPDEVVGTIDARMHRYWDVDTQHYYDIALVLLERPLTIDPIPIHDGMLPVAVGDSVRVVGYGIPDEGSEEYGTKRMADLEVTQVSERNVRYEAGPPTVCLGDSGSPHLANVEGELRVIGTSVLTNCKTYTVGLRVQRYLDEFVYPTIDRWEGPCRLDGTCVRDGCRTPDPDCDGCGFNDECGSGCELPDLDCPMRGRFGDECSANKDCESGYCVPDFNDESTRFCTLPCSGVYPIAVCGTDLECSLLTGFADEAICHLPIDERPTGDPCWIDAQCASGACEDNVCVDVCSEDAPCRDGFQCKTAADRSVCLPEIEPNPPCPDGCSAASGQALHSWPAVLCLLLCGRGRRRR